MLSWEVKRIEQFGYLKLGPFLLPKMWLVDKTSYAKTLKLVYEYVSSRSSILADTSTIDFSQKIASDLEPLLQLWPFAIALPTSQVFTQEDLVLARAFPVHPLGVTHVLTWTDGNLCSPLQFFCHDVDHARYKIREDLISLCGIEIPDAYVDGSTFDKLTGKHRGILSHAVPHLGSQPWLASTARYNFLQQILADIKNIHDPNAAEACRVELINISNFE